MWIESHQELAQHPKTKRLVRLLDVSLPAAIGHLHLLWWWAYDYAQDGDLSRYGPDDVADACGWQGDAGQFMSGLRDAGFVDGDDHIHDWDDYGARMFRKRAANAQRMRETRAAHVRNTTGATGQDMTVQDMTGPKDKLLPEEALQLASKYLDPLRSSSPKVFKDLTPEAALEIASDEGLAPLAAARMLGDVRDWWDRAPPSKRWKFGTRGWRVWCRREANKAAEEEPSPNGQGPQIPEIKIEEDDWDPFAFLGYNREEMLSQGKEIRDPPEPALD